MPPTRNNDSTDAPAKGKEWSAQYVLRLVASFLAAGLGLVALVGWIIGRPALATFAAGTVPMAPSTALLFLLYGTAIFLHVRLPRSPKLYRPCLAMGLLGTVVAVLLLTLTLLGIHPEAEHLGMRIVATACGVAVGHMSPLTAMSFTCIGLSFLALASSSPGRRWRAVAALGLASIAASTSVVLLLAYLFGAPVLYGTGTIPPALPTSMAFLMLGMSLLVPSVQQIWRRDDPSDAISMQTTYVSLSAFALIVASIIGGGFFYFRHFERTQRVEVEKLLSSIADMKTDELADWREGHLKGADLLFKNEAFHALGRRYFKNPQDVDAQRQFQKWIGLYVDGFHFDQVRLIDSQGESGMSVPAGRGPASATIRECIPEVLRSGRVTLKDFYFCDDCRKIHMALLIPVLDETGRSPLGILALRIDPATRLYPYISQWPAPSATAETLLVRREGNEVVFLNELRFRKNTALTLRLTLDKNSDLPAVKAAMGQEGIVEGLDYRGEPVIAAIRAVHDSPWFLVARMDTSEAYAPMRDRLWEIIAGVVFLILGAGLALGFALRQQRIRAYRHKLAAAEALRQSEARWQFAINGSGDGLWDWNVPASTVFFSRRWKEMLGFAEDEIGNSLGEWSNRVHPDDLARVMADAQAHIEGTTPSYVNEHRVRCKDGGWKWILDRGMVISRDAGGKALRMIGTHADITDRKRAEKAKREALDRLQRIASRVPGLVYQYCLRPDGSSCMPFASEAIREILRLTPEEVSEDASRIFTLIHQDDRDGFVASIQASARDLTPWHHEYRVQFDDGIVRWHLGDATPQREADGSTLWHGFITDITDRKKAEIYRDMGREVLQILNEPGDGQDSLQRVLAVLKTRTGFDAVGIRLQDGDDFPYFTQEGFSKEFLLTENTLVERTADGGVCRDKDGNVSLECTCGLVLSGKTDPANPLFTPAGSVWTNDSFPLLDLPSDQDPRHHPRNHCIHHGYASVALVPIRNRDRIVGLIHLNDRRKGCFTLATVELLEGIASHIGAALMRKQAEEAARESSELFSLFMRHSPIYAYIKRVTPSQSVIVKASDNFVQMIGIRGSEVLGKSTTELFPPELAAKMIADDWAVVSTGDVLRLDEEHNGRSYTTVKFPIILGDETLLAGEFNSEARQ